VSSGRLSTIKSRIPPAQFGGFSALLNSSIFSATIC
jgi:hypothetical protein